MTRTLIATALFTLLAVSSAFGAAGDLKQITVAYGDLDLSRPADAEILAEGLACKKDFIRNNPRLSPTRRTNPSSVAAELPHPHEDKTVHVLLSR